MFNAFGEVNRNLLEEYQRIVKMQLPIDYKDFLESTNGGSFSEGEHLFKVDELDEKFAMDVLFGLQHVRSLNLIDWYNEYADEMIEDTLIIGNSIGAGLILLIWQEDWKGIFLWDHCLQLEQSTEEDCLYRICGSFKLFWEMIM